MTTAGTYGRWVGGAYEQRESRRLLPRAAYQMTLASDYFAHRSHASGGATGLSSSAVVAGRTPAAESITRAHAGRLRPSRCGIECDRKKCEAARDTSDRVHAHGGSTVHLSKPSSPARRTSQVEDLTSPRSTRSCSRARPYRVTAGGTTVFSGHVPYNGAVTTPECGAGEGCCQCKVAALRQAAGRHYGYYTSGSVRVVLTRARSGDT